MTQSKKLRGTSERLSTNNFGTWTKAASQTEAGTVLQVPVLVKTLLPRMLMTQMDPQMSVGPTRLRSACLILPHPPPTILRLEHPPSTILHPLVIKRLTELATFSGFKRRKDYHLYLLHHLPDLEKRILGLHLLI